MHNLISKISITNENAYQWALIVRQLGIIFSIILLSNSHYSKEEIGQLEWIYWFIYIVSFFWTNGLLQLLILQNKDKVFQSIKNTLVITTFISFCIALVTLFGISQFGILSIQFLENIPLISAFVFISILNSLIECILFVSASVKTQILNSTVYFIGIIICYLIAIFTHADLIHLLYYLMSFACIRYILFLLRYNDIYPWKVWNDTIQYFKQSISYSIYHVYSGFAQICDTILLQMLAPGAVQFAQFRVGTRELPVIPTILNTQSQIITHQFQQEGQKIILQNIYKKSLKYCKYLFPFFILLTVFSHHLFRLVFTDKFSDSALLFNILLLAVSTKFIFPQSILLGLGEKKLFVKMGIIELLINIGLSITFFYWIGIPGIVLGTYLAYLVEKIVYIYFLHTKYQIKYTQFIPMSSYIIGTFILLLLNYYLYQQYGYYS